MEVNFQIYHYWRGKRAMKGVKMKFIYGKNDFKTQERGEENCWLLTNGLGGFSSCTAVNSVTRNDHALLMASLKAPNVRWNLVHRISEKLIQGTQEFWLSTQSFADGGSEDGYRQLGEFSFEDYPVWRYCAGGVEVVKTIVMQPGKNTVAVRYQVNNQSRRDWRLELTPRYQFVPKGQELEDDETFFVENRTGIAAGCGKYGVEKSVDIKCDAETSGSTKCDDAESIGTKCNGAKRSDAKCDGAASGSAKSEGAVVSGNVRLFYCCSAEEERISLEYETCYYAYDVCDGRREQGRTVALHRFLAAVPAGSSRTVELVYSTEEDSMCFDSIRDALCQERRMLEETAGFSDRTAAMLAKSAGQFISYRESTNSDTILAGFPFFEDWGRDTMIALAGCCISVRRYDTAKRILRTFAAYEKDGLMPNLFPEGGKEPMYNTVDAALLFINSVWLYVQKSGDRAFAREMWPVMERIVEHYRKRTGFGIHMDEDGLIMAGQGLDQVTWMDVRVGEILPTPRHGKPVEINAYWYNALKIMERFSRMMGQERERTEAETVEKKALEIRKGSFGEKKYQESAGESFEEEKSRELSEEDFFAENAPEERLPMDCAEEKAQEYRRLAELVKKSFGEKFWMEEEGYLKDVISGTRNDRQIRCNQIWAVSMPFAILTREQEKKVVQTVWEKLYTPYGLRTLAQEDEEFHPFYGGEQLERDLAYHQGTVWVFPLGGYYLAYLKVHEYSRQAKETVRGQLQVMESALREGCVGQLPEIYDGETPTVSKGCFAQAWSVGEILRVYEALEE